MTHFRLEAVDLAAVHGGVSSQSPLSTPALEPLAVSPRDTLRPTGPSRRRPNHGDHSDTRHIAVSRI